IASDRFASRVCGCRPPTLVSLGPGLTARKRSKQTAQHSSSPCRWSLCAHRFRARKTRWPISLPASCVLVVGAHEKAADALATFVTLEGFSTRTVFGAKATLASANEWKTFG